MFALSRSSFIMELELQNPVKSTIYVIPNT